MRRRTALAAALAAAALALAAAAAVRLSQRRAPRESGDAGTPAARPEGRDQTTSAPADPAVPPAADGTGTDGSAEGGTGIGAPRPAEPSGTAETGGMSGRVTDRTADAPAVPGRSDAPRAEGGATVLPGLKGAGA